MLKLCLYFYFHLEIFTKSLVSSNEKYEYGLDKSEFVPRVVNGYVGKLGDVPYQVAFKARIPRSRYYYTFCGGTILGPRKLLSAAHCFVDDPTSCQKVFGSPGSLRPISRQYAVAGNLRNLDKWNLDSDAHGQWRLLKRVVFPDTYKFPRDDIAVVFIREPFIYNNYVNFIKYATTNIDYNGNCLVSGFGRMRYNRFASCLYLAQLQVLPMKSCNWMFRRNMIRFICTSSVLTDVGKGDSGGPLVCRNTGDPNETPGAGILVGVVSGNKPGVCSFFTRVSTFATYVRRGKSLQVLSNKILYVCIIGIKVLFALF